MARTIPIFFMLAAFLHLPPTLRPASFPQNFSACPATRALGLFGWLLDGEKGPGWYRMPDRVGHNTTSVDENSFRFYVTVKFCKLDFELISRTCLILFECARYMSHIGGISHSFCSMSFSAILSFPFTQVKNCKAVL
jgi:hypothetical protein